MRDEEPCPDVIIERAAEIWSRFLRRPRHDNGDETGGSSLAQGMAAMNSSRDIAQVDDYDAAVNRFRDILVRNLKAERDSKDENSWFRRSLDTDYNPDKELAEAAKEAGVPLSAFSWKTDVSFYNNDCVTVSAGYGAGYLHHYPLSGGRWLICELQGRDMPKIIEAIEAGTLSGFNIEDVRGNLLVSP